MKKGYIILVLASLFISDLYGQFTLLNTFSKKRHSIIRLAYSLDNKRIASCGSDESIIIWDAQGKIIKNLTNSPFYTTNLIFSYDAKYIISTGENKIFWFGILKMQPFASPSKDIKKMLFH